MISFVLRYLNKVARAILLICAAYLLFLILSADKQEVQQREFIVVQSTFEDEENYEENTVSGTEVVTVIADSAYDETKAWEIRFPEISIEAVDGYQQDAYGNYIITEEQFQNPDTLPKNEQGFIDYVFYYDSNGNVLNPLPELYNNYLDYFGLNGG